MPDNLARFKVGFIDNKGQGDMAWLQLKCNLCGRDLLKNTAWQWDSLADINQRANSHECGK